MATQQTVPCHRAQAAGALLLLFSWACAANTGRAPAAPPPRTAALAEAVAAAANAAPAPGVATAAAASPVPTPSANCAALAGTCVCIADDVAQCVDTNASDLSFLRALRNRSRFSEIIVYHNNIPALKNETFHALQMTNLKTVRLAYNGIVTIEPRAFHGLRKLKKLVLVRNNIRSLQSSTFENASKLSLVDLSNNQISEINAVRHVPNLEDCRLANNSITELSPRAFCNSASCRLRSINLANNEIRSVDSWAFFGLPFLESLNLSENKIPSLHYLTLVNTTSLKELDMRRNKISAVNFVCEISSLKYLVLSENKITSISNDSFVCGHQSSLIHIDLSRNEIASIESAAFQGLYSVWDLILSWNRLSYIHPATFLNATNLRSLDLSHNHISQLHFVRDIIMLWNLDLSFNEITTIPSGTFAHHNITQLLGNGANTNGTQIKFVLSRTITNINLSHNRLTTLERGSLEGLYKLYHLDLSWNSIANMSNDIFYRHSQMLRLNMRGNKLSNLDVVLSAPSLQTCDSSSNVLTTLPSTVNHDVSSFKHLHLPSNNISFLHLNIFVNFTQLVFLNLTDNKLNATSFAANAPKLEYLYLSKNNISSLKQHAFNTPFTGTLKSIDVSYNVISSVHDGAFENLYTLVSLNMSNNNINGLSQGTFRHNSRLKDLNLNNNRIVRIEFISFLVSLKYVHLANNSVTNIGVETFSSTSALHAVDLSGNSLTVVPEDVLKDFNDLIYVNLNNNSISRVGASALRNSTKLRTLLLSRNRLNAVGFLEGAVSLEELDLSHNELTALPEPLLPSSPRPRPRLARLNLSHNRLTTVGSDAFRNLGALHALELQGNALARLADGALAQCSALLQLGLAANRLTRLADVPHAPRLKHLYMQGNRLPRLHNDSFATSRLSQVVHLNVSGCGVSEVEAGAFRGLRVLRYLDLSRNAISSLPDALFAANTLLSALDLSHNRLTTLAPHLLRPSACLEFLDASANVLTSVPASRAFGDQIRYLDLSANVIATVPPGAFDGLHKLEVLDLSNNSITALSIGDAPDGSVVLLSGNPIDAAGNNPWGRCIPQEKGLYNLYDISSSELDKFAKLYMWILQLNNSGT